MRLDCFPDGLDQVTGHFLRIAQSLDTQEILIEVADARATHAVNDHYLGLIGFEVNQRRLLQRLG
ncbi:hypothetical protein D3C84_874980 [compost metagenome]